MSTSRRQQLYDHRLVQLVQRTRDISHATGCGVPASTARGWLARDAVEVISHPAFDMASDDLRLRLVRLDARLARLAALLRITFAILAVLRPDFTRLRVPEGRDKRRLLRAIHRGRSVPNLARMLRAIGLSPSRLSAWRRAATGCELDDAESCPGFSPHALTTDEIASIEDPVTSPAYRHVPTGRLALLAQRLRRVFASPSTWHRLVKQFGWRRPRLRLHPGKPREGIRAEKPDELWHVDTTVIRLLDGTKTFLHAVIDNFSRRILAWRVNNTFDPGVTAGLLVEAGAEQLDATPEVLVDGGVENMNRGVDGLVEQGILRRVLAMVDISFSNSLIEAWWRSLKHNWLFLHPLDTTATVRREVAFYVEQHNSVIPHHAFKGQTPDEVYFGRGDEIPDQLAEARADARARRMEANRARRCAVCA
jgi:transposase InsO family protein